MIELKDVVVKGTYSPALWNVTVNFRPGEIVGLFGENGAGKTTLMNAILGFVALSAGSVTLDGNPIRNKEMARISYATSEHTLFPDLTSLEHRDFFKAFFPKFNDDRFRFLLDFFHLPEYEKFKHMSTGQQNQLETILALSQGADYILLDEPFAGSDIFNREDFYKVLLGILGPTECLIVSSHLIEEIKHFVGRVVLIRKAEIVGDKTCLELEEEGKDVISWMNEVYHYDEKRAGSKIADIS
ncbi:MAG: ABC transporter ATP-binding protein [Oscillospiraceae bacterium]|nr:ABC transporter ATP-binding protein [Oscillospiraceae bacterium]